MVIKLDKLLRVKLDRMTFSTQLTPFGLFLFSPLAACYPQLTQPFLNLLTIINCTLATDT